MKKNIGRILGLLLFVMMACPLFFMKEIKAEDYYFVTDPVGTYNVQTNEFLISWKVNFTPVKVEVGDEYWGTIASKSSGLAASGVITVPVSSFYHKNRSYRLYVHYGSGYREYTSRVIDMDWSAFKFISQPTTTFNPGDSTFIISWETGFVPSEVDFGLYNFSDEFSSIKTISSGLGTSMSCPVPLSSLIHYRDYAVIASYNDHGHIYSERFRLDWSAFRFKQQPSIEFDGDKRVFRLSWETGFVPTKVEIGRIFSYDNEFHKDITITKNLDTSMSYDLPFTDVRKNLYIRAYYPTKFLGYADSESFSPNTGEIRFTSQPDVVYDGDQGVYHINWETSYLPVKVRIGWVSGDNFFEVARIKNGLAKNMSYDLPFDKATSRKLSVRAYYDTDEDLDYRDSMEFSLPKPAFTVEASGGTVEPGGKLTVSWMTNFVPLKVEIGSELPDGTWKKAAKITSGLATEMSGELDYQDVVSGTMIVRAWYGILYADSSFSAERGELLFVKQPRGGIASPRDGTWYTSWETNFTPSECEILMMDAGGEWTVTETLYCDSSERAWSIPIDLTSTKESFIFKIRARYNSAELIFKDSQEFVIENPLPVTLTLNYPAESTADRVYTLYKGQSANQGIGSLPMTGTNAYTVEGWYKDLLFITPYTGTEPVVENTTIYAKTSRKSHTVTFVTNGGTAIAPVTVPYGELVEVDPPTRTNYLFAGWYSDAALTNYFPIDNIVWGKIVVDKTLYAKWKPAGIAINETNFPDEDFRQLISNKFDKDSSGTLVQSEIETATVLTSNLSTICSLQGIEYLTELTDLYIVGTQIPSLDLRHNTKLNTLWLEENSQLASLDISLCSAVTDLMVTGSAITAIDTSSMPDLSKLQVYNNAQLRTVNAACGKLRFLHVYNTNLESLDLSACSSYLQNAFRNASPADEGTYYTYTAGSGTTIATLKVDKSVSVYTRDDCLEISAANFPDTKFREYIGSVIDTIRNGWLDPDEIAAVTEIYMTGGTLNNRGPIYSLEGIEHFTNLNMLTAVNLELTEVDLSGNTKLTIVSLSDNDLEKLDLGMLPLLEYLTVQHNPRLSAMVLGENPNLRTLWCYDTAVEVLDLRSCWHLAIAYLECPGASEYTFPEGEGTALLYSWASPDGDESKDVRLYVNPDIQDILVPNGIRVDEAHFPDRSFRSLVSSEFDTDGNGWLMPDEIAAVTSIGSEDCDFTSLKGIEYFTELTFLMVDGAPSLTGVDLRSNTKLTQLDIWGNSLTELKTDGLADLTWLSADQNDLSVLDVSEFELTDLYCYLNPSMTRLELGNQPVLRRLFCYGTDISELDLTGCPKLENIVAYSARTTFTEDSVDYIQYKVDNNNWVRLDTDTVVKLSERFIPVDEQHFPDADFRSYVSTYIDVNHNGWLTEEEIDSVTDICMEEDHDVYDMEGIGYFTSITSLIIDNNPNLSSLDLRSNTLLNHVEVWSNGLKTLKLDGLAELSELACDGNALRQLDVSGFTLSYLECQNNPLTELVLGSQPQLEELKCYGTGRELATLDISGSPILAALAGDGEKTVAEGVMTCESGNNRLMVDEDVIINTGLLRIVRQPEDVSAFIGETAAFSVDAEGIGLTWQWQYRADSGEIWTDLEDALSAALPVVVTDKLDGSQYRCLVTDSFHYTAASDAATLTLKPDFFLPAFLTTIESEAFSGIAAHAVVVPDTVTSIASDAFSGSRITMIYGYAGSVAEDFCTAHPEFIFVEIDDAWMASH